MTYFMANKKIGNVLRVKVPSGKAKDSLLNIKESRSIITLYDSDILFSKELGELTLMVKANVVLGLN
jgi:hypothetical protein